MTTRIYQGRIVTARFEDSDITDNPYAALAETHRLFQDAVNYHIVALAGMADAGDNVTVGGRFRKQVKEIWSERPKGNPQATTLQESLCRTLNLKDATFEEAVADIFEGCEAPEALPYALQFVLDKTEKGEGVIQQQGRELMPKLCDPAFNGNFDFSRKGKTAAIGLKRLTQLFQSATATQEEYEKLAAEMDLSWAGIKTQTKKFRTQEETREQIDEAIQEMCRILAANGDNAWNKFEPQITADDVKQIVAAHQADTSHLLAKNAKAVLVLKYAAIFFMYYPCRVSAALLAAKLPKLPKEETTATEKPFDYTRRDEDPIEESRGCRGYVYKGFTALPNWETAGGVMYEKEWDILAFKEALKAIHGFELKTAERDTERATLQNRMDYILGLSQSCKQEDEEDELPAVLSNDPRFPLLQKLVKELTENSEDREYFISFRARKCSELVFATWRSLSAGGAGSTQLKKAVREIQGMQKQDFGSQVLFDRMAEEEYHGIWKEIPGAEKSALSTDILRDFSLYQQLKEDIERLKTPVRLTAAEPQFSPRALTYSDLKHLGKKIDGCKFRKNENGGMTLAVAIRNAKGRWVGSTLHITYSAPRFMRDGLGCDAATWVANKKEDASALSSWLQPLQKALGVQRPLILEKEPAVTLAIGGCDNKGQPICYLNFPTTLDMTPLHEELGKAALWKGQFLGVQDEKLHLHWPATYKGKNEPWWTQAPLAENGFSVLGIDLGVRYAAAWSLIQGNTAASITGAKGQTIPGRFLGSAEGKTWYGYVAKQGLLRLPGEGHQGEVQGIRWATEEEKQEYSDLVRCIKNVDEPLEGNITILQLNKKISSVFHGLLSRYRGYLQFCYRLKEAEQRTQTMEQMKAYFTFNEATKAFIPGMVDVLEANDADTAFELILAETQRLRALLPRLAERVTSLLLPRKRGKWVWIPKQMEGYIGSGIMELCEQTDSPQERNTTRIYATGGLSMDRLSQLEDWRKQLQSLNRLLCTTPGTQPLNGRESRFAKVIDPCPELLEKIDNIREQRVNQIAHGIVAQALGLRLVTPSRTGKNQKGLDIIHGEYEIIPNRRPVDFVVMENLSRYLMREERSRDENSTLMRWAHRQIVGKVTQLLEEVFGIPVLFTHPAYTSKFDSLSSAAGFRADSFAPQDTEKEWLQQEMEPPIIKAYQRLFEQMEAEPLPKGFSLFRPSRSNSGEYFIAEDALGIHVRNADMNAATNIAWRGIASPEALPLLHRVRMQKKKNGTMAPRRDNAREKAIPANLFTAATCPDDAKDNFTAFYVPTTNQLQVLGHLMEQPLVFGKNLWGKLKARKWNLCHQLNIRLLQKAGFDTTLLERALQHTCEDDIPL